MYPQDTALAFRFLGYGDEQWTLYATGSGVSVDQWFHVDPQPTEQDVIDALASQAYADWLDEHGGDALKTLRRQAKEALDAQNRENALLRAALKELVIYTRDAHANLNALLDGIAGAASLADVKTAAAAISQAPAPANDATLFAGARDAIKARIDAGEGDS